MSSFVLIDSRIADTERLIAGFAPDTLYLGSTVLTEADLDDYEDEVTQIGEALSEEGDLLLYGCNVGAGTEEESFIASLADYTGADVAASIDLTGNAAAGGDWMPEVSNGAIGSGLAMTTAAPSAHDAIIHAGSSS